MTHLAPAASCASLAVPLAFTSPSSRLSCPPSSGSTRIVLASTWACRHNNTQNRPKTGLLVTTYLTCCHSSSTTSLHSPAPLSRCPLQLLDLAARSTSWISLHAPTPPANHRFAAYSSCNIPPFLSSTKITSNNNSSKTNLTYVLRAPRFESMLSTPATPRSSHQLRLCCLQISTILVLRPIASKKELASKCAGTESNNTTHLSSSVRHCRRLHLLHNTAS